jgi:hypothetical protein
MVMPFKLKFHMTGFAKNSLWTILVFILLISLVFQIRYYADYQTTLLPGIYIKDGASDLSAPYWSVPLVYDLNGDGKKDLLVGHNHHDQNRVNHGYVSFYKNIGTNSAPTFNGFTYLQTCKRECSPLDAAAEG